MINVQLNDAVAAALSARAAAHGLTAPAYLEHVLLSKSGQTAPRMSLEELDRLLDDEATAVRSPMGPSHSGSFSRADLYSDHD